jgi:TonB family protein
MQVPTIVKSSLLILLSGCLWAPGLAQTQQGAGVRKLITKPDPAYPALARNINLSGAVKLEVLVLANGSVKTVQIKGGNPLLARAAESAVRVWKWEKSDHETTEAVEVKFTP